MITIEGSFDSHLSPKDAYEKVVSFYNLSAPVEKIPIAHVIILEENYAVILRANYPARLKTFDSITTSLIKQVLKPDSICLASFTISENGLLNLSLPAENIVLNGSQMKPQKAVSFLEKYNPELGAFLSLWLEQIILINRYICPPKIFISND